jgi:prevent-host-death family protein
MNLQNVKSITYVKQHAAELLKNVEETRQPLVVTQNGEARAVMVDVASYQAWQDALAFMKILTRAEADVTAGRVLSTEEVVSRARQQISNRRQDG